MSFFGYSTRAHAVKVLGEEYVKRIETKGTLRKRTLSVCTRGRGYGSASWYPRDEEGRERYSYRNHTIVDYGAKMISYDYTLGADEFSWGEYYEEGPHRATVRP